jgi:hypothetical protein
MSASAGKPEPDKLREAMLLTEQDVAEAYQNAPNWRGVLRSLQCRMAQAMLDAPAPTPAPPTTEYNRGRDELILRYRCGCEICTHSTDLCPATKSSIAMERTSWERPAEPAVPELAVEQWWSHGEHTLATDLKGLAKDAFTAGALAAAPRAGERRDLRMALEKQITFYLEDRPYREGEYWNGVRAVVKDLRAMLFALDATRQPPSTEGKQEPEISITISGIAQVAAAMEALRKAGLVVPQAVWREPQEGSGGK